MVPSLQGKAVVMDAEEVEEGEVVAEATQEDEAIGKACAVEVTNAKVIAARYRKTSSITEAESPSPKQNVSDAAPSGTMLKTVSLH